MKRRGFLQSLAALVAAPTAFLLRRPNQMIPLHGVVLHGVKSITYTFPEPPNGITYTFKGPVKHHTIVFR
jgi:hypothetical protein